MLRDKPLHKVLEEHHKERVRLRSIKSGEGIEEARRAISRWTRSSSQMSEALRQISSPSSALHLPDSQSPSRHYSPSPQALRQISSPSDVLFLVLCAAYTTKPFTFAALLTLAEGCTRSAPAGLPAGLSGPTCHGLFSHLTTDAVAGWKRWSLTCRCSSCFRRFLTHGAGVACGVPGCKQCQYRLRGFSRVNVSHLGLGRFFTKLNAAVRNFERIMWLNDLCKSK
eukprot:s47_g28.t2